MYCRRCNRNNPVNVSNCIYCGAPITNNSKDSTKTVVIVCLIIVIALLVAITGIYIAKSNRFYGAFGAGSSGSSSMNEQEFPVSPKQEMPESPPEKPDRYPGMQPEKQPDVPPEKQPPNEEQQLKPSYNDMMDEKQKFLDEAEKIQEYSDAYLITATTQYQLNYESGVVFEKWDVLLNKVYQYLKVILTDVEFSYLEEKEIQWIKDKEAAINEAAKDFEGGSAETHVRNSTAITYTKERCYYLISLIK